MRLPGRQHPRFVHHDQRLPSDLQLPLGGEFQQLVDAVGPRVAVVAQRHRRTPRDGGRHDLVAVLPVKIRDGTQRRGLTRARRALHDGHPAALHRGVADRQRLLLAQRIALLQQGLDLVPHRLVRQPIAGIGGHGRRHVLDSLFQTQVVPGGIDLGVHHAGAGFGRRLLRLKPLDLRVAAQPLDGGPQRFRADQACRRIRRCLHHVRAPEYRLLPRQVGGKIVKPGGQLPDRLPRDLHVMPCHGGDQFLALDEALRFLPPAAVAYLGIVVVGLTRPRQLVDSSHARGIAERRNAQLSGLGDDRLPPLRPGDLQVLRHADDAGEPGIGTVLLDRHAEALAEVPGQGVAVDGARSLGPAVDRVLVHGPPLAVLTGAGRVEDDAVGMKLRVVLPAGAVLEHRHRDIGRQDPDLPLPVPDPRIRAVAEHRLFQRHPGGVVVRFLDPGPKRRIGDGPERRHALVGREGHVDTRRTPVAARVPGEPAGAVRREAVIEPMKVAAVDLAAVLKAEQALGVEPHPVRFLSRRVVLVGMPERALALQVVRGRGSLGEGGYHGAVSLPGRYAATILARRAIVASAAGRIFIGFRSLHNGVVTSISCRLYHPLCFSATGTLVHRCAKAFYHLHGYRQGDSLHITGSRAGTRTEGAWSGAHRDRYEHGVDTVGPRADHVDLPDIAVV